MLKDAPVYNPDRKMYNRPWGRRTAMRLMVNLTYDPSYKGYVADVPELPGCMSQGKTVEQALKNVKEAITLYLEATPRKKRPAARTALTTTAEV